MPADTPALDVLLAKVEENATTILVRDGLHAKQLDAALAAAAPRLARIVRVLMDRLVAARSIIHRFPKQEFAGKNCVACGEKSGWDMWDKARTTLDPSGMAHEDWCPVPSAFLELAAIDAALSRAEAIVKGEE